jgi:dipeptidyl aminopeptidase/acylaminoacyl peptidase
MEAYESAVPQGANQLAYKSAGRELLAWLARPTGNGPFPAVLYAHAGYSLGAGDYAAIRPFVDAGFVVLLPAWRGENGNPGNFEMCYGEVDDAVAALDFLAGLPDVDPKNLFAAGHDAGGTIVMLLAESTPRLQAAAACGGIPDLRALVEEAKRPALDHTPYDWRDPLETDLRSPARHARDLQCPLLLFFAEQQDDIQRTQAAKMELAAGEAGRYVHVETLSRTDHNTAIDKAVPRMLLYFKRLVDSRKR